MMVVNASWSCYVVDRKREMLAKKEEERRFMSREGKMRRTNWERNHKGRLPMEVDMNRMMMRGTEA